MESNLQETLSVGDQEFVFRLCHRADVELGPVTVDQWWMPVTKLYSQRQSRTHRSGNQQSILDFYWAKCCEEAATDSRDAQERYLLISLLPQMRSQGSRRILLDAFPPRGTLRERNDDTAELEKILASQVHTPLSWDGFRQQTKSYLMPQPVYSEEQKERYFAFVDSLLSEACDRLARGDQDEAIGIAGFHWSRITKQYGRRAGHQEFKLLLDILSYEGRAALHHAYSLVWQHLIPKLQEHHRISAKTMAFLQFWHLDWIKPERSTPQGCHSLFHGHVFALHPGGGQFLQTRTGQQLLGAWLRDRRRKDTLGCLLNGLANATLQYRCRYEQASSARAGWNLQGTADIAGLQAQVQQDRSGRRRLPGPRHDD